MVAIEQSSAQVWRAALRDAAGLGIESPGLEGGASMPAKATSAPLWVNR